MPKIGRDESAYYAENGCKDEAGRLVLAGMMNLAITPAMKPMIMVQRMLMTRAFPGC